MGYDLRQKPSNAALAEPERPSSRASAHSHTSSLGGLGHAHHHDEEEHAVLLKALTLTPQDKGSRITLLGLVCNIALCAVKGAAGWWLSSAALVADAGHSLSDLVGDFVVLACWTISRRPASPSYPYGFGKYESLGTLAVAILLLLGGTGIGVHSYHSLAGHATEAHHHEVVDPNAAWFALASILVKEWLYRATLRVAKEEKSNVLTASAYHHRSDAYSSIVALLAIACSWVGIEQADPVGGLVVAGMILLQGGQVGFASTKELLDQAEDPQLAVDIRNFISSEDDLQCASLRTFKSGALHLADAVVVVSPRLTVRETAAIERNLSKRIRHDFPAISEVSLRFRPSDAHL